MICGIVPINPSSSGLWPSPKLPDPTANIEFWNYMFPHVQIIFLIVTILWQFFHFFLRRLGMIRFTSHMLTGILLSKTFVKQNTTVRRFFSTEDYKETLFGLVGALSYMMFWFLMGVKMDLGVIRNTGKKAITIGLSSVLLSIVVCSFVFFVILSNVGSKKEEPVLNYFEIIFIYLIQCLSSFPVIGNLLFELNLQNSELGRLAISSAVISDFSTSIISAVLVFLNGLRDEQTRLGSIFIGDVTLGDRSLMRAGTVVFFVLFAIYIFRPLMFAVINRTPTGRPVKKFYIYLIIILVFGSAILAEWCKQSIFIGPFILGLAVPHGPPLGSAILQKFESAVFGTFLPFFVASSATELDTSLLSWTDFKSIFIIIVVSFIVKFALTTLPALLYGMPANDCIAMSLIMSFKGIFELGAYAFGFQRGSVRPVTFTASSIYILLNTAIIPPILRRIYDPLRMYAGYEKRNMLQMKPNSELRILSCIYRADDIHPMINLLEATCPSRESPVATYVLHLMELVGRANPVFISHRLQTRKSENTSYNSENVIASFNQFHKDYFGSVSVSTYTALSVPKTMHGDICMLALNNTTSLIILPFHQTWSADGSAIVSDSNMIRKLNKSVVELSPCSVGIFVFRSNNARRRTIRETAASFSSYQVCMLFLGGKDDREALTLAKRMARDSWINFAVVSLISSEQKAKQATDWDRMLDLELLRDMKSNVLAGTDIFYTEEVVDDASQTSELLKSIANKYDLFIVGREKGRKSVFTQGLGEWSEFDELGVIGDLLTSKDLKCQASVLVIQQQKQMI